MIDAMNLDQVIEALVSGAQVRALAENGSSQASYHLVTVIAPVPSVMVLDLIARGLVEPDSDGEFVYKWKQKNGES